MQIRLKAYLAIAVILATRAAAGAEIEIKTDDQIYSYGIGLQIGQSLKDQDVDLDADAFAQAIKDVLDGTAPRVPMERLQTVFEARQRAATEQYSKKAQSNAEAARTFLAENRKAEGVTETDSGLQYKVLTAGDGQKPKSTDTVTVHYRGTLLDGNEFDSSYARGEPATFPVNGVIKGWQEALVMMPVGSKWRVFVPPELGYGEQGAGAKIGPNETLVFEIELLSIN
jgi:FKBP-type peptidyl-prolyl cis-trans isomerase FklB